jgi:hypothetical protein
MRILRPSCVQALVLALLLGVPDAVTAQRLSAEQVEQDLRYLVRVIEQTHPDPYSVIGGKLEFKRRAGEMLRSIPPDGATPDGVFELLSPFLADLQDGHTRFLPPAKLVDDSALKWLPLRFAVASDGLYVSRTVAGLESLRGHRLAAVEQLPVERLAELAARVVPVENNYGGLRALASSLRSTRYYARWFGARLDSLEVQLESPSGELMKQRLPMLNEGEVADLDEQGETRLPFDEGTGPIWWRYLEAARVGYLRIASNVGAESFNEARSRQDLPSYVADYYRRYIDREAPTDLDSALAGIPCFTQTVTELLSIMRAGDAEYLVVDVRGNGGGWSSLALPLYLFAFGDEYLDYPFPDLWVDVASPQFLELNNWGSDDLAVHWGPEYGPGDYRFKTKGRARNSGGTAEFIEELRRFDCGLADAFALQGGRPLHRPTVIVLMDTGTFSAAYQLTYVLWRLGAVLVGVPPAQAGNAFTNAVQVTLPNSRLRGTVARSAQIFFPEVKALGRVLRPTFPMTWSDYARYDFDRNAEVMHVLRLIAEGRIPGRGDR